MTISPTEIFRHIRRIQITTTRKVEDLFAGIYRSIFKGKGLEFEDVREYQPGDDIRSIDWNVTARMQTPYVKNFHEERELTVFLLVDISASSRFGSGDRLKSEIMAEIAAVLAFSAIKNQDKVGLILFTDEVELYIKPKKGTRHVLRVIREILFFRPKNEGTNLQSVLEFFAKVQKKHAICFLISDFITSIDPLHREANIISKRHELVFVYVYDNHEREFPKLGLLHLKDLEKGEMSLVDTSSLEVTQHFSEKSSLKQKELIRLTQRVGAGFIPVSCEKSYVDPLRKFFKLRGRKH